MGRGFRDRSAQCASKVVKYGRIFMADGVVSCLSTSVSPQVHLGVLILVCMCVTSRAHLCMREFDFLNASSE